MLARRVAARLKRYDLAIDDSAGVPVARTVPGAFLDLVLGAVESDFAPPELMALLKHPLALLGRRPGRDQARRRGRSNAAPSATSMSARASPARRGARASRASDGKRTAGASASKSSKRPCGSLRIWRPHSRRSRRLPRRSPQTASRLAEAHAAVAEALARDRDGSSSGLWQGDAGEALSVLLAELIDAGDAADAHRRRLSALLSEPRRRRGGAAARGPHPRLFIWGPLEARLQQPDVVILGSLNEGVWPRPQEASPWLSRPMRETLGLSPPERRIGLSAHDFAQGLGARHVYLTRALKVDGVPTVPSRWLQRLSALVKAAGLEAKIAPEQPWVAWARRARYGASLRAGRSRPSHARRSRRGRAN